jgi:hypothetical protein
VLLSPSFACSIIVNVDGEQTWREVMDELVPGDMDTSQLVCETRRLRNRGGSYMSTD